MGILTTSTCASSALGMGHGGTSNATKEVEALRLFLQSAQTEGYAPNGPWQYDCVDLTRQVP